MSDLNKLRSDVEWWKKETELRKRALSEAINTLEERQRELIRVEREEASRLAKKAA